MNGLLRGMQLMVDFFALKQHVVINGGNEDARPEFDAVEATWLKEMTNTRTIARAMQHPKLDEQHIILALALGNDPFAESRHLLQALQAKYAH